MTLKEMQTCAAETLDYFLEVMPDAPFTKDDIIIEFVPKERMAERAAALCEQYVPNRHVNESQAKQLVSTIAGNALIGRDKSAVISFIDYKASHRWIREMMFHEFAHIYCTKMEMDGEHFIDIYGSGATPENPDMTPEERQYDGLLVAGHYVWSEFIAQYYALLHTAPRGCRIVDVIEFVVRHLGEITLASNDLSKGALAQIMAALLTCTDAKSKQSQTKLLQFLFPDGEPMAQETRQAFIGCFRLLQSRLDREEPWKITEDFIAELGAKFVEFKGMNSFFCGVFG
jgi:hypothetical protein